MTHLPSFRMGILSVAMFTLLAGAVLSPSIATTRNDATATPGNDDALYQDALPWDLSGDAEKMVVHRIVDGDTVQLTYPNDDWYYPTRIIGIQAPEMDGPYTEEGCYGPEAKAYLSRLLPVGSEIYVQKDRTDEDRNGRRLRHIFVVQPDTDDAYLVSEVLVLGGYADARSYPPDDLYDDVLQEAEELAREERAGLWKACDT
ncbi:MAG: thermonuclease family protein [Chloroflexota bacterium]|nr:thermonuclease family protein [Chloroflexota bacterium]